MTSPRPPPLWTHSKAFLKSGVISLFSPGKRANVSALFLVCRYVEGGVRMGEWQDPLSFCTINGRAVFPLYTILNGDHVSRTRSTFLTRNSRLAEDGPPVGSHRPLGPAEFAFSDFPRHNPTGGPRGLLRGLQSPAPARSVRGRPRERKRKKKREREGEGGVGGRGGSARASGRARPRKARPGAARPDPRPAPLRRLPSR